MPAEKLSKGNQQKIQFMTAVIHNPELVVLDEPFSGLDPVNTEILKNIIIGLIRDGKYVIMSAHQMATIEEFCTDILILNRGKTVLQGNLKEIKETYPVNRVEIDVNESIKKYIDEFNLEIENEANNCYIIKLSDNLLTPPANSPLVINWNNGSIPNEKYYKVDVSKIMNNMVKITGMGYNIGEKSTFNSYWVGWLPIDELEIMEKL